MMGLRSPLLFWLAGLAAIIGLLWLFQGILLPFVAGMAIAYFLDPVADKLEDWGLPRAVATAVITLAFFGALVVGIIFLVPLIEQQIESLIDSWPFYAERFREWVARAGDSPLLQFFGPEDQLDQETVSNVTRNIMGWAGQLLQTAWAGGMALVNLLSLIFITPVVAFYLLLDWDRMVAQIDTWLPRRHAPTIRRLAREIDRVLSGFVRGQAAVMLSLAVFYAIALTAVGLKFGLLVGLISGLISFVPFLGAIVGFVLSMILALFQFWPDWLRLALVAAVYLAGQALEGNIFTPRFVGREVGLHPVWVIFAVLAFGSLFGFVGMLLAVPLAAAIGVLVRFFLARYVASPLYTGIQEYEIGAPPEQEAAQWEEQKRA